MKIRLRDRTGTRDYKYVIEDVDRHGNVRVYLRRRDLKIRLRETPGTQEFETEYMEALKGAPAVAVKRKSTDRGSLRWLVEQYYGSERYKRLGESTQTVRRRILDGICEKDGTKPYALMKKRHVLIIRDEKARFPEAANARVKALRQVFKWAVDEAEIVNSNPAQKVSYLESYNPDGWHTWTIPEVEKYMARHPIGTKAYKAVAIGLYAGVRRGDAVQLGRQMERNGDLHFTEKKNQVRNPKHRVLPILPQLRAAIDAAPSGHLTYIVNEFGKPFTPAGFGNWFRKRCNEAGLHHCSFHGLRKAGATIAADNGATEHQLMAIYGWTTTKQAGLYTKKANRSKLAKDAMHLLVPDQEVNKSVPLSEGDARSGTKKAGKA